MDTTFALRVPDAIIGPSAAWALNGCRPAESYLRVTYHRGLILHEQGQHLRVDFGWYQHHGISLSNGTVVHFGRGLFDISNACIEVVSRETFSADRPIQVLESPVSFSPSEIAARALSRVGEKGYEVFGNNCEHFVAWCRTGTQESSQITMTETAVRQMAAIGSRPLVRRAIVASLAKSNAAKLPLLVARGTAFAAIAADAAQTATELAATSRGKTRDQSKRLGRRVGLASSATLGFAVGGPPGAAASVCFWLTGQLLGEQSLAQCKQQVQSAINKRFGESSQ